jgi:2,3-bisphosphoglycerate-dependent phosphoglycerate mutase
MTYTLVLLRHGESEWNAKNLFTGWVDVALSEKGTEEAKRGGTLLTEAGVLPDVVHTSLLRRAITTANLALDSADRHWIPVKRSWRLNERHYGALQGKDKKQTLEQFGEEQFMLWRRSYDVPPPAIEPGSEFSQTPTPVTPTRPRSSPSASRTCSSARCRTGRVRSSPTSRPARPSSSRRTATRCARSSCISST